MAVELFKQLQLTRVMDHVQLTKGMQRCFPYLRLRAQNAKQPNKVQPTRGMKGRFVYPRRRAQNAQNSINILAQAPAAPDTRHSA